MSDNEKMLEDLDDIIDDFWSLFEKGEMAPVLKKLETWKDEYL